MAKEKDTPSNEFKRVLTVAMKTIAEDPELSVAFGNEAPSLAGNRAKLPQVANELKPADIAIVRGLSDSFALRIANHNDKVHARYQPQGKNAHTNPNKKGPSGCRCKAWRCSGEESLCQIPAAALLSHKGCSPRKNNIKPINTAAICTMLQTGRKAALCTVIQPKACMEAAATAPKTA